jgi:5-methylcytosine-specific restriction endonuclease McrA
MSPRRRTPPPPHIYARRRRRSIWFGAPPPPVKNGRRAAADQNFTASVSDCQTCSSSNVSKWQKDNRDRYNKYFTDRYATDAVYKTNIEVRRAAHKPELLGCSKDQYNAWLRYTMPQRYTTVDIGPVLQVDHVIPLSTFDPTNIYLANHWSNMQLLTKTDNLRKGKQILDYHIDRQIHRLTAFTQEYPEYDDGVTTFTTLLAIICFQYCRKNSLCNIT